MFDLYSNSKNIQYLSISEFYPFYYCDSNHPHLCQVQYIYIIFNVHSHIHEIKYAHAQQVNNPIKPIFIGKFYIFAMYTFIRHVIKVDKDARQSVQWIRQVQRITYIQTKPKFSETRHFLLTFFVATRAWQVGLKEKFSRFKGLAYWICVHRYITYNHELGWVKNIKTKHRPFTSI